MLQTIREHTQGWIAGTIITIIILTFALWGIHSYFVGSGSDTVVAKVDGVEISKEQLAMAYERARRQVQLQYGANARNEAELKQQALQALINVQVLRQASISQKYRISDRQVDNYLEALPEFQVNGQFSLERFQEVLSTTLLSTSEFLELIRAGLLIDQPRLGIVLSSFALPEETNYTISLVNQERDIEYGILPLAYFLTQPIIISPEKIRAYYEQHQNDFKTPEQVNIEYIELSLKDLMANVQASDATLKNFYNENMNSYTEPMSWKLMEIQISIASNAPPLDVETAKNKAESIMKATERGEDFAKFTRLYPGKNINSQSFVTLNQIAPELQKEVANLAKAGQVAGPLRTSDGFVILKALDVKQPQIQPYEAVKSKVSESFARQQAEEKFAELRDRLADVSYEHPESLAPVAKALNLPVKTSELFTKDKGGKDISALKKVRDTAFSNDVLNLQNNSDVIQVNPETIIVLRVKSHIASTLLPLNSVSQQIEDKLKMELAEERAKQLADEIKTKLQKGTDPLQIAQSYHLEWKKLGYMGRYSTKVDSAILDLAFRLPYPQNTAVYGATRLPSGYAIVALKGVKEGTISDHKQYAVFAEQVQNSEGLLEYELYKQSQISQAKIKIQQQ